MFGSSAGASSGAGGIFSFNSPAATTPQSQSVFGNTNLAFTYASSPSSNNDQMNMNDSMAEDTVQATTSTIPTFDQQPTTSSSGFVFGSTLPLNQFYPAAPSGMNQFGNSAQSGANPFQLSGFVFGSTPAPNQFAPEAPSGMNQFGNSAQSGENPFQLSGFVFGSSLLPNQFAPAAPSGMNQFGNSAQPGANPFQFGASQNTLAAPASVEYNGGGFSLGSSGGGHKSNRRIIRLKKNQRKK